MSGVWSGGRAMATCLQLPSTWFRLLVIVCCLSESLRAQDISLCPCDLTGNVCNINCCCDPDCSQDDIAVFQCLPSSELNTVDNKQCFSRDIFLFENGPATSQDTDDGLFCIYFDNDESRNFYQIPSVVTSDAQLQEYAKNYGKFSFQSDAPPNILADLPDYYASGDPMYVVYPTQTFSYLGLPAPMTATPECVDGNAAAYLQNKNYQCTRIIQNLTVNCENLTELQALTFYDGFRVVKDPYFLKAFNTSAPPDEFGDFDLGGIVDLFNNTYTLEISVSDLQCINSQDVQGPCSFSTPPLNPTYNAATGTCENALVQVHYTFSTTGNLGVDAASVSLVFQDLPSTTTSLQQTYSATFTATSISSSNDASPRSGNPGYIVGLPVLAGVLNQTTTTPGGPEYMQETSLGLVRPSAAGTCSKAIGSTRETVLFGEDMRTGCYIILNLTQPGQNCRLIQQQIISALEGFAATITNTQISAYSRTNLYLATFGNSDPLQTGDWVRVLYQNRPDPPSTPDNGLCTLSLGMNIQILYANVGSLANPQPKIIGAAFVYDQPQEVNYRCSGPYCQPGLSSLEQKVEISSSVTFIDVSQLPENVEGAYPTFAVRLPYDFFYPFLQSHSSQTNASFGLALLMFALSRLQWS